MPSDFAGHELQARLARLVADEHGSGSDVQHLQNVVDLAVHLLAACVGAGVTEAIQAKVRIVVSSGGAARRSDELQAILKQGPCVDVAAKAEVVRVVDLRDEGPWEVWRSQVTRELGVRSALCLPIFSAGKTTGTLNLYSTMRDAFDPHSLEVASALVASPVLTASAIEKVRQLENGMKTRSSIGQAMGLLMATYRMKEAAAFATLTRLSSASNLKLAVVAQRLVERHEGGDYLHSKSGPYE